MAELAHHGRAAVERARAAARGYPGARLGARVHIGGAGRLRMGTHSRLGNGVRIFVGAGAVLELGERVLVGDRTVINVAAGITVGADSEISWQCQLLDTDFHELIGADGRARPVTAAVRLGRHVLVGTGALILKGVDVGDGAVIGAGSVVTGDVAAGLVVGGNPARALGSVRQWR